MHIGGGFLINCEFGSIGSGMSYKAISGPYYIGYYKADNERKRGNDLKIQQCLTANPAYFFHIVHAGYAKHYSKKNNRRDKHGDQVNESLADELCRRPERLKAKPGNNTQNNACNYLEV